MLLLVLVIFLSVIASASASASNCLLQASTLVEDIWVALCCCLLHMVVKDIVLVLVSLLMLSVVALC